MAVRVQRKAPEPQPEQPIEEVTFSHVVSSRKITVRPNSTRTVSTSHLRTVVMTDRYGEETKWTATLVDLRVFGQSLVDMADGK